MSDQPEADPVGRSGSTTLWGVDPDGLADWVRGVLVALLFALPFAILVLILWRLILNYLPGFDWARIYPVLVLAAVGLVLYRKHRSDQRNGLRVALRAELDADDRTGDAPAAHPVYDASIDRFHLLTDEEIEALVAYHALDPDAADAAVAGARDRARNAIASHLAAEADRGPGAE